MADEDGVVDGAGTATGARARRIATAAIRLPITYCVALAVLVAPPLATLLARRLLGDDPTPADIAVLGYGWPALEGGRWWTPFTSAVVDPHLAISFVPSYTFFGVALLEHRAKHLRTLVVLVVGSVAGVFIGLLLVAPLRGHTGAFAAQVTTTIDFGISVGGFACLGAWTGYLSASWRRPIVVAVSCYLVGQLLLSGLIFDVTHPVGWTIGVVGGRWIMQPARVDGRPVRLPVDALWIGLGALVGSAVGIAVGELSGGVGGAFGWGP